MARKKNGQALDLGQNYSDNQATPEFSGVGVTVIAEGDTDALQYDEETNTTQIELPDGTVSISMGPPAPKKGDAKFNDNLAEYLSEGQLSTICEKILLGIDNDIQSRASWLENVSNSISLLGLELKQPRGAAVAAGSTPNEGISTVDHPLLLEAVLRFQANARGELLPTDGPIKIRNDGESNALSEKLSSALEKDLNHYLTKVASEYYPDTDRMLLMLGFCGISFKKGYHDPIKRRPVIKSIDAKDLIVSNAKATIDDAGRVTHRVMMAPSTLKRMQMVGAYRDINLPSPGVPGIPDPVDTKINEIQGIAPPTYAEQEDQDRELYECYCEIDIPGYEHEFQGKQTGLPLPYKVVIDKDSRRILEIRRNWEEDDPLCMPRNRIIAYIFIPGLGFYGIGLVNILGNATKAVTAAWRLLLDAGMFSTFPGFLYVKSLARQMTNQFRVPPGGGMPVDTAGQDIRASIMPLPYKDPNAVFIQLIDNIATTAQRVGGTAELQVGEGKQDAPVGTTLAMMEQATKLISAVHKRLHQSQGQEFDMLKSLIMEDPECLWRHNPKKSKVLATLVHESGLDSIAQALEEGEDRHIQLLLAALADTDLVPAADPNTSSQTERYLKVVAMRQMAQTNPGLDMNAVDMRAMNVMGIDDPESLFKPPMPQGAPPPDPRMISAQAQVMAAQARMADSQTAVKKAQADLQGDSMDSQLKQQEIQSREKIAALGVARAMVVHRDEQNLVQKQLDSDNFHQNADRQADMQQNNQEQSSGIALAKMNNMANNIQAQGVASINAQNDMADRQHQAQLSSQEQQHQAALASQEQQHQKELEAQKRDHEINKLKTQARVSPKPRTPSNKSNAKKK